VPGSKSKVINIQIPPGIESGQQIRYEGMGDHSITNLQPGDLIVNINVQSHPKFKREGTTLYTEHEISVWDAMAGSTVEITMLDNKKLSINIPSGTQPETVLRIPGEGLPNMRTRQRGNAMLKIKVAIPKNLTKAQIEKINKVKNEI
jgi:DnaJ-class molecular chaperone